MPAGLNGLDPPRLPRPRHELVAARLTMLLIGAGSVVALGAGLIAFLYYEPTGQRTGLTATVDGVHPFDTKTHEVGSGTGRIYNTDQPFVAVVDWSPVPAGTQVAAIWVDALGSTVGGIGPADVSQLPKRQPVGTALEEQGKPNLPGGYVFVVERYSGGRPVEVLARTSVYVQQGG